MHASSPTLACSLRRHWLSMTALMLLIGQASLEPVLSWSVPRLIPKQGRLHDLRAWRNCQPSSDNGCEVVSSSGTGPSIRLSPMERDWRERSLPLDSERCSWLL